MARSQSRLPDPHRAVTRSRRAAFALQEAQNRIALETAAAAHEAQLAERRQRRAQVAQRRAVARQESLEREAATVEQAALRWTHRLEGRQTIEAAQELRHDAARATAPGRAETAAMTKAAEEASGHQEHKSKKRQRSDITEENEGSKRYKKRQRLDSSAKGSIHQLEASTSSAGVNRPSSASKDESPYNRASSPIDRATEAAIARALAELDDLAETAAPGTSMPPRAGGSGSTRGGPPAPVVGEGVWYRLGQRSRDRAAQGHVNRPSSTPVASTSSAPLPSTSRATPTQAIATRDEPRTERRAGQNDLGQRMRRELGIGEDYGDVDDFVGGFRRTSVEGSSLFSMSSSGRQHEAQPAERRQRRAQAPRRRVRRVRRPQEAAQVEALPTGEAELEGARQEASSSSSRVNRPSSTPVASTSSATLPSTSRATARQATQGKAHAEGRAEQNEVVRRDAGVGEDYEEVGEFVAGVSRDFAEGSVFVTMSGSLRRRR